MAHMTLRIPSCLFPFLRISVQLTSIFLLLFNASFKIYLVSPLHGKNILTAFIPPYPIGLENGSVLTLVNDVFMYTA